MAGSDVKLHAMLLYLLIYLMLNYMKLIIINFNGIKMIMNFYKQTLYLYLLYWTLFL